VNLLASNLERFSARRLTRIMLLFAVALIVVIVGFQTVHGHRFIAQQPSFFFTPDGGGTGAQFVPVMHDSRIDIAANLSNVLAVVGVLLVCAVTLVLKRTGAGVVLFLLQLPLAAMSLRLQDRGQQDPLVAKIARSVPYYALQILVLGKDHLPHTGTYARLNGVTTTASAFVVAAVWTAGLLLASGALFARVEVR
jgi:hypothetical protein